MEKEFIFNLKEKLEYSRGGEFVETATLELSPPSMASYVESAELSQYVMGAFLESQQRVNPDQIEMAREVKAAAKAADAADDDNGNILEASEIKVMLFAATQVRFATDIVPCFRRLLPFVCTLDGTTPMKSSLIDRLQPDDFTNCICEYIVNFITPSLLSGEGD